MCLFGPWQNVQTVNVYIVYIPIFPIARLLKVSSLKLKLTDPYSIINIVYGITEVTVYVVYISRLFGIRFLPQTVPAHHLLETVSTQPQLARGTGDVPAALVEGFDDHPPLEGSNAGLEITPVTRPQLLGQPDSF